METQDAISRDDDHEARQSRSSVSYGGIDPIRTEAIQRGASMNEPYASLPST